MKEQFINIPLVKNDVKKRFEIEVEGHFAFINFEEKGTQMALVHTEVPTELAGMGVASALVEKTLHWVADNGFTLLPFCPFIFAYIKKHPEWKRIVDKHFKAYNEL